MSRKYITQFNRLKTGSNFSKNGYKWKKRSTRTAEIVKPVEYKGKWFYFGQNEPVYIRSLRALKAF